MPRLVLGALLLAVLLAGCTAPTSSVVEKKEVLVRVGQGDFDPARIYAEAAPAVATVLPSEGGQAVGQGSGFLLPGGLFATNAHVVLRETGGAYNEIYLEWQSGERSEAEVVRIDPDRDLALLQTAPPEEIQPLVLSPRETVLPGEPVAAIGSPFGESQSLSTGIVSAIDRSVESLTDFQITDAIQTDASINPGNSGGPLLDGAGDVIGINQQIMSSSGGNDGVGYAIPVRNLRRLVLSVREGKALRDAYLGISTQEVWPQLAERLGIPPDSLLVSEVVSGGPSDRAGIRGGRKSFFFQGSPVVSGGDVLFYLDGQRVKDSSTLSDALRFLEPGDKVRVVIWRDGKKKATEITLGERPG